MNYEKKYKEALGWMQSVYPTMTGAVKEDAEHYFPELKDSEDEKISKALIHLITEQDGYLTAINGISTKDILAWLERQGKQKPADKVESKFKVGDWVVTSYGKVNQVIAVDEDCDGFTLDDDTYFSGSWKDSYHLWTIQDAKDGDVLVNGSNIFIFHFLNDTRLMGYCHVNIDNGRFYDDIGKNECFCLIDAVVNPATKEQCDLLFKKMSEAGYEWNVDKKELKIINSYCQEYCKGYQETGKCFVDGGCNAKREAEKIENTSPLLSDFFNAEYERGKADALQSIEWSEEDEEIVTGIINDIQERLEDYPTEQLAEIYFKEIKWLKSIKNRIKGE